MEKLINWMTRNFEPKVQKMSRNPWIAGVQDGILTSMPVIFIGSFITLVSILANFIKGFPDVSQLYFFSMGILSVILSYLIPSSIMEKKKHHGIKKQAGIAGLALFLILCAPKFKDGTVVFSSDSLGNGGMFQALVAALVAAFIMNLFARISFFKEDTAIPDFITVWFNTLIPMLLILSLGWFLVYILHLNVYAAISSAFMPLVSLGDSLIGFVVLYFFGYVFLYSFGISSWVTWPLEAAIIYTGVQANQAAVAAGHVATRLNVDGIGSYICLGGSGCTLALAIMFLLLSKAKKNKVIGRAAIIPSIFNINEPLVYGAPIAFNGILMIPFWITGLFTAVFTWMALAFNWVPRITVQWDFWYLPKFFGAFAVGGLRGLILLVVIFIVSWVIYYPFFRIYDNKALKEEQENLNTQQ